MSKEVKDKTNIDCLEFTLKDKSGWSKKFIDIISDKNFDQKKHFVPTVWPDLLDQSGPCCGIYSAYIGFKYSGLADPGSLPYPRKLDMLASGDYSTKRLSSLRKTAKKEGITNFGPIYRIQHFSTLAKSTHFTGTKELRLPETEKEYIDKMCQTLDSNQTMIVSADINYDGFPSNESGDKAHWALVFGYIYIGATCYFLTNQYGEYYLWNATDLFNSNKNLPTENPTQGTYIKIKKSDYRKVESKSDHSEKNQYTIDDDLKDFRFTAFAIPALPMRKTIDDFPALARAKLESFSSSNLPSQDLSDYPSNHYGQSDIVYAPSDEYSSDGASSIASAPPSELLNYDESDIDCAPSYKYFSYEEESPVASAPPPSQDYDEVDIDSTPPSPRLYSSPVNRVGLFGPKNQNQEQSNLIESQLIRINRLD